MTRFHHQNAARKAQGPTGFRLSTALGAAMVAALATAASASASVTHPGEGPDLARSACERGMACLWGGQEYDDALLTKDLRNTNPGDCVPLSGDFTPKSLANRSDRDLTVYSDRNCNPDKPHPTYPGGGTFTPKIPITVTAIKIAQ
ncbi:peptidase inhibitor family I36 protein [Sciscionella sediminilitoris]|uniref:peptidase inhibitor family I36 protein n=1 Tax=Sciscionella sediminilitoris TaxID=1445613 RepID=UPI0007C82B62|nr:peptidase inhibitor family I36 protein [Sciscionella sp. SE31]